MVIILQFSRHKKSRISPNRRRETNRKGDEK
jgi:hypothetical protein